MVQPDELGKLTVLSGVWQFPVRVKCATLAWHTLRSTPDGLGLDHPQLNEEPHEAVPFDLQDVIERLKTVFDPEIPSTSSTSGWSTYARRTRSTMAATGWTSRCP